MSGHLYQLKIRNAYVGQPVQVNGPHDKYGVVIKLQESGFHLIRGVSKQHLIVSGVSTDNLQEV